MRQALRGLRRGIALPVALLALVALAAIPAVLLTIAWAQGRTERARSDASLAMELAESGAAHAAGVITAGALKSVSFNNLLLGFDNAVDKGSTVNDGRLIGFNGLNTADQIPVAGRTVAGGKYFVKLIDDPADADGNPLTDSNGLLVIQCRGETFEGSTSTVNLVWTRLQPLPVAVATGGILSLSTVKFSGRCRSIYAQEELILNGQIETVPDDNGMVWSVVGGKVNRAVPEGNLVTGAVAALNLPTLTNPLGSCPATRNLYRTGDWGGPASNQRINASTLTNGVYCVTGNVYLTGATSGGLKATIIAGGHISIVNPSTSNDRFSMTHFLTDGTALLAGGDVQIDADSDINGSIYCGSQFDLKGISMQGQVVCRDNTDPAAAGGYQCSGSGSSRVCGYLSIVGPRGVGEPYATPGTSSISIRGSGNKAADSHINFACKDKFMRPGYELSRVAWYPSFGTGTTTP